MFEGGWWLSFEWTELKLGLVQVSFLPVVKETEAPLSVLLIKEEVIFDKRDSSDIVSFFYLDFFLCQREVSLYMTT